MKRQIKKVLQAINSSSFYPRYGWHSAKNAPSGEPANKKKDKKHQGRLRDRPFSLIVRDDQAPQIMRNH